MSVFLLGVLVGLFLQWGGVALIETLNERDEERRNLLKNKEKIED